MRRVLLVDLASRIASVDNIEGAGMLGLGGKVLGIHLLEKYLSPGVDPLDPNNIVVLTPSAVAALGMPGSNRFGAFTKSPLTGAWLESYCGGSFARILREAGWDAVVISGAADLPVRLHITADGATVIPAEELWGQDTRRTEVQLLACLEKRSAVLCIGVAGERLVRVANVMHEHAHTLGRGGMGAVFGSKRLKAVSVAAPSPLKIEASEQFTRTRREVSRLAADSPVSANYRRFGTPIMVAIMNEAGGFPGDFFTKGSVEHRLTLEAETWPEWASVESESCLPCPMRCRKRLTITDGSEIGRELAGPEYETLYVFGGSCMVRHARDVAVLNEQCNLFGIDTISAGNLVAAAMKGRELGAVPNGPEPGHVERIGQLLEELANRSTALGDLLAQGLDQALDTFGMSNWSITSKRLDPAGYEPRRLKGMALSYALSVRGACHLRSTFYKAELSGGLDGLDDDAVVRTYIDWENRMLLLDSLTMCRFYRDFMSWDNIVSCASELSGAEVYKGELEALCQNVTSRIRRLNFTFGLKPSDDTVAERFFLEPTEHAPPLDRQELAGRIRRYWLERGWTENGWVADDSDFRLPEAKFARGADGSRLSEQV